MFDTYAIWYESIASANAALQTQDVLGRSVPRSLGFESSRARLQANDSPHLSCTARFHTLYNPFWLAAATGYIKQSHALWHSSRAMSFAGMATF
eukprot:9500334-Karenia_brevis.AAC.1